MTFPPGAWRVLIKFTVGDDCWEWKAARTAQGYGQVRVDGVTRFAHRVVYEMVVGPIPSGLEIDHLCRNPSCVRPDHLEPVTHAEHVKRTPPGRRGSNNAIKTHCPAGHAYDETNTRNRPASATRRASRECMECDRNRHRKPVLTAPGAPA